MELDKIYAIQKNDTLLGVWYEEKEEFATVFFQWLEDAERYIISWGLDPSDVEFIKFKGWNGIYEGFKKAAAASVHATIDPPRYKESFQVFEIQPIVDQIEQQMYHPYS